MFKSDKILCAVFPENCFRNKKLYPYYLKIFSFLLCNAISLVT